jgi:hypothetical protein
MHSSSSSSEPTKQWSRPPSVVQTLGPEVNAYRKTLIDVPVDEDEDPQIQVYGRYVDSFARKDGEWRISMRSVVVEQSSVRKARSKIRKGWIMATRDGNDQIQVFRCQFGLPEDRMEA